MGVGERRGVLAAVRRDRVMLLGRGGVPLALRAGLDVLQRGALNLGCKRMVRQGSVGRVGYFLHGGQSAGCVPRGKGQRSCSAFSHSKFEGGLRTSNKEKAPNLIQEFHMDSVDSTGSQRIDFRAQKEPKNNL